jgi:2,4-dichlorophenol 6-monooxygenase
VYGIGDPSTGGVISPTDATDRWIRGIGWYPERGERLVDYDTSCCIDIVRSAVGVEDLPVAIADVRAFRMVAGIADRYVAGRLLLPVMQRTSSRRRPAWDSTSRSTMGSRSAAHSRR